MLRFQRNIIVRQKARKNLISGSGFEINPVSMGLVLKIVENNLKIKILLCHIDRKNGL
jgi:hypothetical protein